MRAGSIDRLLRRGHFGGPARVLNFGDAAAHRRPGRDHASSASTARAATGIGATDEEDAMQLGMIGLGRMGANMVRRLMRGGHQCVVYDMNPKSVSELAGEGATPAASLEELVAKLTKPR